MRVMLAGIGAVLVFILIGYGVLVLGLYTAQRALLYHPSDERPRPGGSLAETVQIMDVPGYGRVGYGRVGHDGLGHNGVRLFTWYLPPPSKSAPVIVYFHGNAGNQLDREARFAAFRDQGWGVVMPTYRYNAGAGGTPSEDVLISDARAVLDWVAQNDIEMDQVILFGESLGTGIVIALAAQGVPVSGIILDSPYDSITAVAAKHYWFVPVKFLLKDSFQSDIRIRKVTVPLLIGHGGEDTVIPASHGERLFELANEPKTFAYKPLSGHVDLFDHGFMEDIKAFINALGPFQEERI